MMKNKVLKITSIICAFVMTATCGVPAYSESIISVPKMGAIMDEARESASKAAIEIGSKSIDEILQDDEDSVKLGASVSDKFNDIAKNVKEDIAEYDYYSSSLSSALKNKKGNCFAYSLYTKIACDKIGVPCDIVFATKDPSSISSGMHIWCIVNIDNVLYWSDMSSYSLGYGDMFIKSREVIGSFNSYKNYYILDVATGGYKEMESLSLDYSIKKTMVECSAARQTSQLGKSEYAKCKDIIFDKFSYADEVVDSDEPEVPETESVEETESEQYVEDSTEENTEKESAVEESTEPTKEEPVQETTKAEETKPVEETKPAKEKITVGKSFITSVKLKSDKKTLYVKFKKLKNNTKYTMVYQIKYYIGNDKIVYGTTTKPYYNIKKLKSGKTYKIKVRAYIVKKNCSRTYGKWSSVKKYKVKKAKKK